MKFDNEEARHRRIKLFDEIMAPLNANDNFMVKPELWDDIHLSGFFDAPASTKYHGAYKGGLFDHSANVAKILVKLTEDNHLKWERPESPFIVGMFHDFCKVDEYVYDGFECCWTRRSDCLLKGHGDKSVMMLSKYFTLTTEEILCIRYHMGAFVDQKEWNDYTGAIHAYPNVLWTHHADMMAAHIVEVGHG